MSVETLEFDLIIKDDGFDTKVNKITEDAKKLNTQLSKLLQVQGNNRIVTEEEVKRAEQMNILLKEQRNLESKLNNQRKRRVDLEEKITEELGKQSKLPVPQAITYNDNSVHTLTSIRDSHKEVNKEMARSSRLWMDLKNMATAYFSIMGAERLVSSMIRISAEFEQQRISLEAILRDVNGADRIFEQIKSLAIVSPFTFKELVTYTKQLSAFSVPMGELYDTTKMLADVSAGLGVGMDRLILAYGQIRSASFLRGQEVRQLTEAGVPILQELSKMLSDIEGKYVSVGEVFDKISSRQVTFEMVAKVFQDMTSEGGKFYKMQEVLAETLQGKLSNLTDAYQIMFAEIGEKTNGLVVQTVDALKKLAQSYEEVGKTIVELTATYGAYRAILLLVKVAQQTALEASLAKAIVGTGGISTVKALGSAMAKLVENTKLYKWGLQALSKISPYAALAAGAAALGFAMYKAISYESDLEKLKNSLADTTNRNAAAIADETDQLDFLFGRLEKAKGSTEEYLKVKNEILNQYGQYISDIVRENLEIGNLTEAYKELSQAIIASNQTRYLEEGKTAIKEYYDEIINGQMRELEGNLKALDISKVGSVAQQLKAYLRGEIEKSDFTKEAMSAYSTMLFESQKATYQLFGHKFANPENLRGIIADAKKVVNEETQSLIEGLEFVDTVVRGKTEEVSKDWQKQIRAIIDGAKQNDDLTINLAVEKLSLDSVIEEVKNQIKSLNQEIYNNEGIEDEIATKLKLQLGYWEKINKEVLLGKATESNGAGRASAKDPRIEAIQAEIEAYKTLQEVYEDFLNFMDEQSARDSVYTIFKNIYGDKAKADFMKEIIRLSQELERLDPSSAEKSLSSIGVADSKKIIESYKAFQKYNEELTKLTDKYGFEGDKVSRILVQLTTDDTSSNLAFEAAKKNIKEIELKYKTSIAGTEEEKNKAWEEWKNKGIATLRQLYESEKAYNRKVAQEKITDLAQSMVKDNYAKLFGAGSKALSDWGDKTLAQITNVINKLKIAQSTAGGLITPAMIASASKLGINFKELVASINEIINADINNAIDKYINKAKDVASKTKTVITDVSSILSTIGETLGNDSFIALSNVLTTIDEVADIILDCDDAVDYLAKNFSDVSEAVGEMEEGMLSGAEVAEALSDDSENIVKSFSVITMIIKVILLFAQKIVDVWSSNKKAAEEATEAALEYKKSLLEIKATANDGIFGVDQWNNVLVRMREYQRTYNNLINDIQNGAYVLSGLGMSEIINQMGMLDENGNISIDWIMAKYEAGQTLGMAEAIIENAKKLESAISDIFSQISDDIVNNMVTAFEETGDAMSDFENAFADLGENIAKSLIKSYVIENILNKYKLQIYNAIDAASNATNTENGMFDFVKTLSYIAESMKEELGKVAPFINELLSMFQKYFGSFSNGESSTLASGITSITEDTANLLASYINAIRADVAGTRISIEGMSADVKAILGLLPSTPTLAEYLTKIEANTFNTSLATADILSEMRSMMTNERGETALRVYM